MSHFQQETNCHSCQEVGGDELELATERWVRQGELEPAQMQAEKEQAIDQ